MSNKLYIIDYDGYSVLLFPDYKGDHRANYKLCPFLSGEQVSGHHLMYTLGIGNTRTPL